MLLVFDSLDHVWALRIQCPTTSDWQAPVMRALGF